MSISSNIVFRNAHLSITSSESGSSTPLILHPSKEFSPILVIPFGIVIPPDGFAGTEISSVIFLLYNIPSTDAYLVLCSSTTISLNCLLFEKAPSFIRITCSGIRIVDKLQSRKTPSPIDCKESGNTTSCNFRHSANALVSITSSLSFKITFSKFSQPLNAYISIFCNSDGIVNSVKPVTLNAI